MRCGQLYPYSDAIRSLFIDSASSSIKFMYTAQGTWATRASLLPVLSRHDCPFVAAVRAAAAAGTRVAVCGSL